MDPRPTVVGYAGEPGDEDSSRFYGDFCVFFRDTGNGSLSSPDDCYSFTPAREYALDLFRRFLLVVLQKIFMNLLSHIIIVLTMEIILLRATVFHVICIQDFQEAREQSA